MHIPQGPTAALALELFDDALAAAPGRRRTMM